LGRIGSGPVTAAFFNFHPDMVSAAVPMCWEVVSPGDLVTLRAGAASRALHELCDPAALGRLTELLPHLRTASANTDGAGRCLAGANRELWPQVEAGLRAQGNSESEVLVAEVWQACTTLREHRGDGHVAALVAHGIDGLGAHLLASGTLGVPREVLRDNRGWSESQWNVGISQLVDRGLLQDDGTATEAGRALHQAVESMTDSLAEGAYEALADTDVNDLYGALLECATAIHASGLYPFPNPMGLPPLP
jgi:helix-turn-helix protein